MFEGALKSLFAVAEAYPDLKANEITNNYKKSLLTQRIKIRRLDGFTMEPCEI